MTAVRAWLAARSERERHLIAIAGAVVVAISIGGIALAVHDDLVALRARVASHEHELAQVRRLAGIIAAAPPAAGDDGTLLTRLQAATDAAQIADRVTAMTPAATPPTDGGGGTRLTVQLSGTSLADIVHLLHALDEDAAPLGVARVSLRKHLDDPHRFDVTLEIAGGGS